MPSHGMSQSFSETRHALAREEAKEHTEGWVDYGSPEKNVPLLCLLLVAYAVSEIQESSPGPHDQVSALPRRTGPAVVESFGKLARAHRGLVLVECCTMKKTRCRNKGNAHNAHTHRSVRRATFPNVRCVYHHTNKEVANLNHYANRIKPTTDTCPIPFSPAAPLSITGASYILPYCGPNSLRAPKQPLHPFPFKFTFKRRR